MNAAAQNWPADQPTEIEQLSRQWITARAADIKRNEEHECQSAGNLDPLSASKNDPPGALG